MVEGRGGEEGERERGGRRAGGLGFVCLFIHLSNLIYHGVL